MARADTALFRFLGELQATQRELFARVNEARRLGRDDLVLDLVSVSVRLRPDISIERLSQVSSVGQTREASMATATRSDSVTR
jgi:hypothetical protein